MTAKEILKQQISVYSNWVNFDPETSTTSNMPHEYNFTVEQLNAFCDQLCKEQREICAKSLNYAVEGNSYVSLESILNAKQPEL